MTPQEMAQVVVNPVCTGVLVSLTLGAGVDRQQVMRTLPEEMRETAKLYLAGKIVQWWSHVDQAGALFLFDCTTVEEAKALSGELPLVKEGLADLSFTRIGPLMPILTLMQGR
jgi:muconolactone delta-isomerase